MQRRANIRPASVLETLNIPFVLETIAEQVQPCFGKGRLANYIPALAEVDPNQFGIAVSTVRGDEYAIGSADVPFSIQSIAKLFTLILAMHFEGDRLWERVGREPSGTRFNSLVQLEYERGRPRNPLINAGALVTLDRVCMHHEDFESLLLDFIRFVTASNRIDFDREVMESELRTGDTNRAVAYLLKSFGMIDSDVERLLVAYFHQCSVSMTCTELARAFVALANAGVSPHAAESIVTERQARRINSLMLTCGMYDAVGSFAYRVGLPAKSGVGGGVVAVIPGLMTLAVWGPELDESGNSVVGVRALEMFTDITGLSVF